MKKFLEQVRKWSWLSEGVIVALIMSILFMSFYDNFQRESLADIENPLETEDNISWLYANNQLLYRDLYNIQNEQPLDYVSLYYNMEEPFATMKDKTYQQKADKNVLTEEAPEEAEPIVAEEYLIYEQLLNGCEGIRSYFQELESEFRELNAVYDYMITDTSTGQVVTNTGKESLSVEEYYFYITFRYDEKGNVANGREMAGEDTEKMRKYAFELSRVGNGLPSDQGYTSPRYGYDASVEYMEAYTAKHGPVNCEIIYAMSRTTYESICAGNIEEVRDRYQDVWNNDVFNYSGYRLYYDWFLLIMTLLGIFLPLWGKEKPYEQFRICRPPLEALFILNMFLYSLRHNLSVDAMGIVTDEAAARLAGSFISMSAARLVVNLMHLCYLAILFTLGWYTGICLREIRDQRIGGYIQKRSIIYGIFPFIKRKCKAFYYELTHIDITKDAKSLIFKIILINAVVLFIVSSIWVAGFALVVVYSLILYFVLKKYVSNLQKKYKVLLSATNEIAQGNLNVTIQEDLGIFEPFRPEILRIQQGFKKAVEEEVKSQRMKGELITNVSHDLKTPLTAIITYIDLLKDEKISEEQRKEYLDTLERKSLRLKLLIEDLFEISKATSKTVKLNIMDVDILNLVKQAQLELSDKLDAVGLEVRMTLPEEKIILPLDSQKTFRIYENLFGNIAKYALPGTRVYVKAETDQSTLTITLKNISAQEILISPEELTDRFVRGDASRNTEGSGLGLAIAKSFTELQNGKLTLEVDGDLFKVTTIWQLRQ